MSHILVAGKLFEEFQSAGVTAFRESDIVLPTFTEPPPAEWSGSKIPLNVWREILAFFKWTYDTTKSESQVRLFHNPTTGEWRAHAFPQVKGSGLTTREIEDHPNRDSDFKSLAGFTNRGTVHHHCTLMAFQSGTDRSDEMTQPGLHLTVGHMDKEKYDLHSRLVVLVPGELDTEGKLKRAARTIQCSVNLVDWFELPKHVSAVLPLGMHADVLGMFMTTAATEDEKFPDRWRENVIEGPARSFGARSEHFAHWEWDNPAGLPLSASIARTAHTSETSRMLLLAAEQDLEDHFLRSWDAYNSAHET